MANYYELLQVPPTSSPQEIEVSLDRLYNETRRKVTNFDPQIATQANQALQLLEQMRSILLSPDKRNAYDTALGIGANAGGLVDPEAIFRSPAPPAGPVLGMPTVGMQFGQPMPQSQVAQPAVRTDAWTCPTCHHPNLVGAQFCAKDGVKIGHPCPKCEQMAELANNFCPACGADKRKVYEQKQQAEIEKLHVRINGINAQIEQIRKVASLSSSGSLRGADLTVYKELRQGSSSGCAWMVAIILFITISAVFTSMGAAQIFYILFALGISALVGWFVYSSGKKSHIDTQAKKRISELQSQLPGLQQQISEVQSHQYPN